MAWGPNQQRERMQSSRLISLGEIFYLFCSASAGKGSEIGAPHTLLLFSVAWEVSNHLLVLTLTGSPQALGYYEDSVALGVTAVRRSLGCEDRFGLSVEPPFVHCHPHGATVWPGSSQFSSNEPTTARSRVSASFPRDRQSPGGREFKQYSFARRRPC